MSSNDLLLILHPPRIRPRDIDQFYQIWRSDAARYRALVTGPPVVHPLPPDVSVNKAKRTASAAFDGRDDNNNNNNNNNDDARSDPGHERVAKRRAGTGWDFGGSAVTGLVERAANVYRTLVPANWSMASGLEHLDADESYSEELWASGSEITTPTWQYQTVARTAIPTLSDIQGSPEKPRAVHAPRPIRLAPHIPRFLQEVVRSPQSTPSLSQAPQTVFFPDGALPAETDLESMNAILMLLSVDLTPPPPFEMGSVVPNDFLYAARMRLWPPNSHEHDDLLPWMFLDYTLAIDTCEALLWFLAYDFSKLDIEANPDGTEEVTVVGFNKGQDSSGFEYRNVLPEAPLERVEGKAQVVSSDGASLLLRRWHDAVKVPFVPHTWRWMKSDEQSDEERMTLPRILAYAVDSKTAAQPFDGRLGLTVPGYKGPWEEDSVGVEARDQVTFWDALCHNVPREELDLEFTIRLLFPLPRDEAISRDKAQSFIYFGKETPCVMHHNGLEYHPVFSTPIPVVPNTRVQGRYDLWTVRLLAVTLLVPPNDTSPTWKPIRIDMPNHGVRAILDTASMNSTFPPAVIKAMCNLWFRVGDVRQHEPISHAAHDKFSDHDLVFTFGGAGGVPVEFRCDATFFLGRLWEDRLVPELFRWSHVRSSNDDESDIAVLGMLSRHLARCVSRSLQRLTPMWMQNFFWGAFVKFSAPYHGSGAVPLIQLAAQRAVVGDQKIHGPWDCVFA